MYAFIDRYISLNIPNGSSYWVWGNILEPDPSKTSDDPNLKRLLYVLWLDGFEEKTLGSKDPWVAADLSSLCMSLWFLFLCLSRGERWESASQTEARNHLEGAERSWDGPWAGSLLRIWGRMCVCFQKKLFVWSALHHRGYCNKLTNTRKKNGLSCEANSSHDVFFGIKRSFRRGAMSPGIHVHHVEIFCANSWVACWSMCGEWMVQQRLPQNEF